MYNPKRCHNTWEGVAFEYLNIPIKRVVTRRGKWVVSTKPRPFKYKLNTDGSRKGAVATCGGVVRDSNGDSIIGFAMKLENLDTLMAELEAIFSGLRLCVAHDLMGTEVETDSEMAYNMKLRKSTEQWKYSSFIRRIRLLLPGFEGLHLTFREGNKFADGFACIYEN